MLHMLRYPLTVLVLSFLGMWLSALIGVYFRKRQKNLGADEQQDRDLIVAATLTLLALIIGFSFSMAISRYDLRKSYEEAEANAIGTEYVRADLLPPADAAKVRTLLRDYTNQRILFYEAKNGEELAQANKRGSQLQNEMWHAVTPPALQQQTAISALTVSGMNDVLNSQGYAQAAAWNRIPVGAWLLMGVVAVGCNLLVGYGARQVIGGTLRLLVLPIMLCVAFFLIADMDSPRRGVIRVLPQNLLSLAQSMSGN